MTKKIIMTSIRDEDLNLVDKATKIHQRSRASFVRYAIIEFAKKILAEEKSENEKPKRRTN